MRSMSFPLFFAILISLPAITFAAMVGLARLCLFLMVREGRKDPEVAKRMLESLMSCEPQTRLMAEPHYRAIRELRKVVEEAK